MPVSDIIKKINKQKMKKTNNWLDHFKQRINKMGLFRAKLMCKFDRATSRRCTLADVNADDSINSTFMICL